MNERHSSALLSVGVGVADLLLATDGVNLDGLDYRGRMLLLTASIP